MKKIRTLLLLLSALFLLVACNDDDDKESSFYFDMGVIDSNENTNGRDFGIYKWDLALDSKSFDGMVVVVPYDEMKKELIFSGQSTVELTIKDSTYYADPIYPNEDYEEYVMFFRIEDFHGMDENYTITYIHGDEEENYSITIPYVNYLTSFSHTDVEDVDQIMTLEWELDADNHYQLLSAQHTNDFDGWDDELYPSLEVRVDKSIREYTFPKEYQYSPNWRINYYSLIEIKQNQTSDLIGLSLFIVGLNIDGQEPEEREYNKKEIGAIVRNQYKSLHKVIMKSIRLNS